MLLIIQLETAEYCFSYHCQHPFNGRHIFDGNVGESGSACPRDTTRVESVFLTTGQHNVSVEAQVTLKGAGEKGAALIDVFDKSARIVSSSIKYTENGAAGYDLSVIAHHANADLRATNVNISLTVAGAKNLVGLVSKQEAAFSLNYVRINGEVNCSNASSLLVATQAQAITARQLVTDITLRAPQAAGLVLEQFNNLNIHNSTIRVDAESNDSSKTGASAISMKQTNQTNIHHSTITATLKGKECAAMAVTQSGVLTITQTTITATVSEAKNASGLVVRQSARITLDTVIVHPTISVEERAAGFVVEQQAALITTNCQINGVITQAQLAAGVVHIQAGELTITHLLMNLNITAGDNPASLIYSAQNTISLDNITGTVRLTAGNKMVAKLMSVSGDNFRIATATNITVNIQGEENYTIMCPCFAPNKCLEDATLQKYCRNQSQKYTFESLNTAANWSDSFYEFNYDTSEYTSRYKYLQPQLFVVKLFTDCNGSGCPDVNNSVIKYNFGNSTANRISDVKFSGRDFSTFYIRSSYYNIMIIANNMHMSGDNTQETLFGGFMASLIENRQFINCHIKGYIGNNPNYTLASSQFTVGGFVAQQNCDKLEFIRCTIDAKVYGTYCVGGFIGRQDKGTAIFTNCTSNSINYDGSIRSFFLGLQNNGSSQFTNCSADGRIGDSGSGIVRGAFVGKVVTNTGNVSLTNCKWTTTDNTVNQAVGSGGQGRITAVNVTFNGNSWQPNT